MAFPNNPLYLETFLFHLLAHQRVEIAVLARELLKGNRLRAAPMLGIGRTGLQR
jgi:DNA-binding protein Fis